MGRECHIGFADLFSMARKRSWTPQEEERFKALDQSARNGAVEQLARDAGWIRTEPRRGSDGLVYTAFWVEGPPWFEELNDLWSPPVSLDRLDPSQVPNRSGCFALTADAAPFLIPRRVIAVGSASSLRQRISELQTQAIDDGSIVDRSEVFPPPSFRARGESAHVRWISSDSSRDLAASLQDFLEPLFPMIDDGRPKRDSAPSSKPRGTNVQPILISAERLAPADPSHFTGAVALGLVAGTTDSTLHIYEVQFAARARTVWHAHSGEQILLGLQGRCVMQMRGEPPVLIPEKSAVRIPAGVVHWHGALDEAASHLAVNIATQTTWLDPVREADYDAASAEIRAQSDQSLSGAQAREDGRR